MFLPRDTPRCAHALIAFDRAQHPHMAWIAQLTAAYLERAGIITDVADAATTPLPPPPDYELVVVGVGLRRFADHAVLRWAESVATSLADVPSVMFVVSRSADPARRLERTKRKLAWHPLVVHVFSREHSARAVIAFVDRLARLITANVDRSGTDPPQA